MVVDYSNWFRNATGHAPHPWQVSLATEEELRDRLVCIPTGFGKTLGVASTWLYHRVVRGDLRWPTRLVWALPMRTLVEQSVEVLQKLVVQAGASTQNVQVHTLMGGVATRNWHLEPEAPAILVGTQDMLLSRALNRGYAAARARWPIDFGLLSVDSLWVLDEVQLMDVGLATAVQLAAFRARQNQTRPTATWAMSATVQERWLAHSVDARPWVDGLSRTALTAADEQNVRWSGTHKPVTCLTAPLSGSALADEVWQRHQDLPAAEPLTLVVLNTVERAREARPRSARV